MIVRIIEFFRARLKGTIRACLVLLALVVLWDALFVPKEHACSLEVRYGHPGQRRG